tara:strand:- start:166 stop:327 length:162 start_codon:yes stop_codon:yes gene_type:complete
MYFYNKSGYLVYPNGKLRKDLKGNKIFIEKEHRKLKMFMPYRILKMLKIMEDG